LQVIVELIAYLSARGSLSLEDLNELARRGFIERDSIAFQDYYYDESLEAQDLEPEQVIERLEPARTSRRGPRPSARSSLTARQVSDRIMESWSRWELALSALGAFASKVAPATDFVEALRNIEAAEPTWISQLLAQMLRERPDEFDPLWDALASSVGEEGVIPEDARGSAVQAYRAILVGRRYDELGRYRFACREPGLSRLLCLVRAQRVLLLNFGRLFRDEPHLFDRAFSARRPPADVCYWTFVLAVTAWKVSDSGAPPWRLHRPARPSPEAAVARRAWGCAALMDLPGLRALLETVTDTHLPPAAESPVKWDATWFR
jgi:hypothetical protein